MQWPKDWIHHNFLVMPGSKYGVLRMNALTHIMRSKAKESFSHDTALHLLQERYLTLMSMWAQPC